MEKLKHVLAQLKTAVARGHIVRATSWRAADSAHTVITIQFQPKTHYTLVEELAKHFQRQYKCKNVQQYSIDDVPVLTLLFPQVLTLDNDDDDEERRVKDAA